MSSLQTYKLRARSCAQVEPIVEDKSLTTFGLTFFIQQNKPKCNTKCGKCSWQEIMFDNDPIWLVNEVLKEEEKSISFLDNQKNLKFNEKLSYRLLCVYDLKKNVIEELNHFRGIFFLNSKYYLVDDMISSPLELKNDFLVTASCMIFFFS